MKTETAVNSEDESMKKSMIWLMASLFGVFFGLIMLASSVAS